MSENSLLILGAGGLGQVVAEIATEHFSKIAFLDDEPSKEKQKQFSIIGRIEEAEKFKREFSYAIPAFGCNSTRYELYKTLRQYGFNIPTIIHPSAVVSPSASIGEGTIIRELVGISRDVIIEECCLINMGAMIDHGCKIGYGSHIPMRCLVRNEIKIPPLSKLELGSINQ